MRTHVPMVDLRAQYLRIHEAIDAGVARVVSSTQFIGGEDCRLFEQEFPAFCGARHAVGVALHAEELGEDRLVELGLGTIPPTFTTGQVSKGLVRSLFRRQRVAWPGPPSLIVGTPRS